MVANRWDETWHRLVTWTNGQGPSERLAAQILLSEGYVSLDPLHPLGGPDGGKDALAEKDGKTWLMAVTFPRGPQGFADTRKKFLRDLKRVAPNRAEGIAFVTNQELASSKREKLKEAANPIPVDLYHLERVTTILDQPRMSLVRKQFLAIESVGDESKELLGMFHALWQEKREAVSGLVIRPPVYPDSPFLRYKWPYNAEAALRASGGDATLLAELDYLEGLQQRIQRDPTTDITRTDIERLERLIAGVQTLKPTGVVFRP